MNKRRVVTGDFPDVLRVLLVQKKVMKFLTANNSETQASFVAELNHRLNPLFHKRCIDVINHLKPRISEHPPE